jgi:hypothetical protein
MVEYPGKKVLSQKEKLQKSSFEKCGGYHRSFWFKLTVKSG